MTISSDRLMWLDDVIKKMTNSAYGRSGMYYELYIEVLHDEVYSFLMENQDNLSQEEIEYVKFKTEYSDNLEPYVNINPETGEQRTIHDIIRENQL